MKVTERRRLLKELHRHRSSDIDTPSWLWRDVAEPVQAHEGGYLEHCRRFANTQILANP
jgi:uncharacterized protein (DUF2252 family)